MKILIKIYIFETEISNTKMTCIILKPIWVNDVSGKEFELNPIGTKYKINLDFSNLEHGLYLINIQTINQEVTKQFVKL